MPPGRRRAGGRGRRGATAGPRPAAGPHGREADAVPKRAAAQYRCTVPQQELSADNPAHLTTTVERGSFAHARCSCGWAGPARRSRDRARSDARAHSSDG
ncbi:hypothetical protein GCM10023329_28370 [Streptomyces sanyensis]|uniref:Uncharacterized protein n=1 Tax=Streptomyces sanyensis TaxID=568869 RepID=A0ABP9AD37_9ACTN